MQINRETEHVEFKESLSQLSRGLESLAAMLNKHGSGTVLFGISDSGEVVGLDIGNKTMKDISRAVAERIKPAVLPHISEELYGDRTVIRLEASGTNTPYSADGNYYIRSGNENRKIDPDIMRLLIFKNAGDSITEIESGNQSPTFTQLWQLYVLHDYTLNKETFAKNTGLLTKNGRYNLLAELLSDSNDFSIKVVRFKGTDKSEIMSRNEFGYKCLLLAFQSALDFTLSFNETRVDMSGIVRKETGLFDESSLREAWVNACRHTRWDRMIPPAIYIFDDRIEIISTGGLPVDFSEEDFFNGISHPINRQLQKIMGQLGLVEQTGHGVPEIIKHYGREAFTITPNNLNVTLCFPFRLTRGRNDYSHLSASETAVLRAIGDRPSITIGELSRVTGLGTSRISTIIRQLKETGRIVRVGSNKSGWWEVR